MLHLYLNAGMFASFQTPSLPDRWAISWMPSPLRTRMFVKCSEALHHWHVIFQRCIPAQFFPLLFPCLQVSTARICLSPDSFFGFPERSCAHTRMCVPRWWNSFWTLSPVRMLPTSKSKPCPYSLLPPPLTPFCFLLLFIFASLSLDLQCFYKILPSLTHLIFGI